ncbi:REP-associated tyrosine transposase [Rubinisphaera italica]|uniref:Transposase IS200 like protein n=1 Tax=Rubinisphaera italica TaxID=2527969 RepID=A0A5C5XD95_9PLAN|nr:transposase [Rubinisphaera italica]TWT61066.1 Transposase IS200 like protein [Rubinisphaera italica]
MPNYRRANVPGGSFFFTVVTDNRRPILNSEIARKSLLNAFQICQSTMPFEMNAVVVLPDHIHTIWTLPRGDTNFSKRWGLIKSSFTKQWLEHGGMQRSISEARNNEHRKGVWQPRFWEHTIVDEDDFESHFDYLHYNPVKHGLVKHVSEWPSSSFHRWVKAGVYSPDWGRLEGQTMEIIAREIKQTVGE